MAIEKFMIDRFVDAIAAGQTIDDFTKTHGLDVRELFKTLKSYPELLQEYACAQEIRAERLANDIINIADTEEDSQRARNRIGARQWLASKLMPNKYGERLDVNVNQVVDLSAALLESRNRVSRQVIETTAKQLNGASGSKPAADDDDIFS